MNRHDRRAEEAKTRNSFTHYSNVYRNAFNKADDRRIGEGFMRGAKAEANGIAAMVLHPPGATPPSFDECDVAISASYGEQQFRAVTKAEHLDTLQTEWPKLVEQFKKMPEAPVTDDMRFDARGFIFSMLMDNWQYVNGEMAAMTASAIVWLVRTSAVGPAIGQSHKSVHYEITDTGPGQRNYRLMLS
jgi:hypothetical protein